MNVRLSKSFLKQYKKLRVLREKIDERLVLFRTKPFDRTLNNHALSGVYKGFRSINITGNYRALYELRDNNIAFFITIDTHSNLYS